MTVGEMKVALEDFPEDAEVDGYEGEDTGLRITRHGFISTRRRTPEGEPVVEKMRPPKES